MTYLFIHTIGRSKFGGGERWVVKAAKGLMKEGHNAIIIGLSGSKLLKWAQNAGIPVKEMNIVSDISPWHIFKLRRFLIRNPVDVIITRVTDLFVTGMAVKLLPKNVKRPRVIVRHGLPMLYKVRKHLLLHRKLANGIITNANSIKEAYIGKGFFFPEFVTVVHNGTEAPDKVTPYNFSRHFPEKRIILSAGRLARQKGYEHLIDAIALLPKSADDLVFVVLGKGKLLNRLKRRAANKKVAHRIRFWGFVDDINPYLAGCDLFVLPSLYEGMPNAVMEAMAAGKAVIACNVNGLPELVHHNENGLLIPPGDPPALAQAITHLIDNPHLRRKMGHNAAQHIKRNFSTARMVDGVKNL